MLCADRHDALPPAVACAGSCIVLNATAPATFRPEYCPRCRRAHACAVAGPGPHRDWRLPHLRRDAAHDANRSLQHPCRARARVGCDVPALQHVVPGRNAGHNATQPL